jgi:hypothetical protein
MSKFSDPVLPLPFYPGTKPRFHAMVKPTGAVCNLNCTYCYYLHKEQLLRGDSKFRIYASTLKPSAATKSYSPGRVANRPCWASDSSRR